MSRTNMDTRHAHSALLAAPQSATANSRSSNSSSESSSNKNNINVGVGDDSGNVSAVSIDDGPHFRDIFHYGHEENYKLASSGITNLNSSSHAHQTLSPISISNASTPESFPEHPLGLERETEPALEAEMEAEELPPHQSKYLLSSIKATKRLKDARPFLKPVDPIALNIPHYFNYVQTPMDLSLIETKLQGNVYHSVEQVTSDFKTMVDNCLNFNGPESSISSMAKRIQKYFEKKLSAMPPRVLPASALKKTSRNRKKMRIWIPHLSLDVQLVPPMTILGKAEIEKASVVVDPKEQFIHPNQKICLIYMKTPNQNQRLYKKNSGLA
ncbi:Bromodomain family protein [Saccharomyces cerevisiae]|nr:Bromodomain family protein [Saccharomyces cerevisiae]